MLIGHRKSRFLPAWLETYREYNASSWYYNAGERPTKEVLEKRPHIGKLATTSRGRIHHCNLTI